MSSRSRSVLALALLSFSCVDQQEAKEKAAQMAKDAAPALEKGKEVVADGVDAAKPALEKGVEVVGDTAKALVEDLPDSGELSDRSKDWLEKAEDAGEGIEGIVAKGTQLAPVALEIGRVVNESVDKDMAIEPIYQELGDETAQAELDEKLAKMPKTQEVDGVKIGFKQLTETSSEKKITEKAYLVIWRRDDHLVGFIYRTRSEVDIDKLIAETPRLVKLIDGALAEKAAE